MLGLQMSTYMILRYQNTIFNLISTHCMLEGLLALYEFMSSSWSGGAMPLEAWIFAMGSLPNLLELNYGAKNSHALMGVGSLTFNMKT